MQLQFIGAGCFGFVIGWICYRTLRLREGSASLSDLTTVIAALGGGAITTIFKNADLFGAYSIGLAVGFIAYYLVGLLLYGAGWWKNNYFLPPQ